MKTFFITLFSALILIGCSVKKSAVADAVEEPEDKPALFQDITDGDSLFAGIERGACFGRCPIYKMKIYNSGYVHFEGIKFCEPLGVNTTQLTKEQMKLLLDKANEIKYKEMEDKYDMPGVTDLPTIITSLVIDGERKTVARRYGYPQELLDLEKVFTQLIETSTWEKKGRVSTQQN